MATACALFASCSAVEPLEIVKQIIIGDGDSDSFPLAIPMMEDIKGYPWHVDTKYYTADINLCTTDSRTIGDTQFAEGVQAVVILFDTTDSASFELVKAWLPYLKEIEPAVQIIVCNRCAIDDVVPRRKTLEWCIENEFELVELNPIQDDSDIEEDFPETTGVKRIIQALHAHTWPNLEMKERPTFRSPMIEQLMREEAASQAAAQAERSQESENPQQATIDNTSNIPQTTEPADNIQEGQQESPSGTEAEGACAPDNTTSSTTASSSAVDPGKAKKEQKKKSNQEIADKLIPEDDMAVLSALGNDDPGEESFEVMFERLRVMKEKAEALPPDQRKAYAEKVAIEFWKSIGGDAGEISGLSDSD